MCDPKAGGSSSSKSGGGGNNNLNIVSSKQNIDGKSKYNEAYWANQIKSKADGGLGLTQAEVAAAQKAIGMDKAYSGDKVVTTANKDTAAFKLAKVTGSDAVLGDGVTKTTSKSGLFGENTTDNYDYSGNNPDVTVKTNDPQFDIFGNKIRVGAKTSTTFVDGTATNTVTNATGAANGVNSVVTNANADDIDDTVVADTVVSKSGTGTGTKGTKGTGTVVVKKEEGAVTKKVVPVADTSLGGGANNANSALANKNSLAIARNRRSKSRRKYLRSGTAVAGGGNTSLNIPT